MNVVRTVGLLGVVWALLLGIAWLADAIPDVPDHTRGSAADYQDSSQQQGSDQSEDGDAPGYTRGSAADYNDPSAADSPADLHPIGRPSQEPPPGAQSAEYDGPWEEPTTCDELADASALRDGSLTKRQTLLQLAELRYPPGVAFIEAMDEQALNTFAPGTSFDAIVSAFDTIVHEGSHFWAARRMRLTRRTFSVIPDDSRNLRTFQTFDRARIVPNLDGPATDTYKRIYLEGASGAQGLETLLDETNAYVHSLASATCIRDLYGPGRSRSSRDGILAMLYYLGEYLRLARVDEPRVYGRIRGNGAYVRFIIDQWERAHYWLARSASYAHLGIYDAEFAERVHSDRIRSEYEMLRRALPEGATASP